MVNLKSKKLGDFLVLINGVVLIILINALAAFHFFRIDLTDEGRYSIKDQTKEILRNLDDNVYVEVYLDGELNSDFKRFRKSIEETLHEFKVYSGNKIQYTFTDPNTAVSQKARTEFMRDLASKGIQPTNVIDTKDGQRIEKIIFPGVLVSYGGFELGVTLLKGNKANTPEEEINQSIEGIEYELATTIFKLANTDRKRIGMVTGHGELDSMQIAGFNNALLEIYDVRKVNLDRKNELSEYDALIIAKPKTSFSQPDKFKLDQYIMNGGKVMFLLDKLEADVDSASGENYFAYPYQLNLDDQLFKYGVRINLDLVQDRSSGKLPVIIGDQGGKPRMQWMEWPFYPLINHYADHPITRNLDAVLTKFVSSIDTVKATGVRKTPILMTSQYSRTLTAPVNVSVNNLRQNLKTEDYRKSFIPIAYLLEGSFSSPFKNRFLPEGIDPKKFKGQSINTKIMVIADGDIARNDVNTRTSQWQPLGYDVFSKHTFANQDLLINMMLYLTDENGLIRTRNKEIKIRPLDRDKAQSEKITWQVLNLILPVLALCVYGIGRSVLRKRKYTSMNMDGSGNKIK